MPAGPDFGVMLTIANSTISDNEALRGGGIYFGGGRLAIANSALEGRDYIMRDGDMIHIRFKV